MYRLLLPPLFVMLILAGCDTTATPSAKGPSAQTLASEGALSTLSEEGPDYRTILTQTTWRALEMDLAKMAANARFPEGVQTYPATLSFRENRVVAYANCFKIVADYELDGRRLYFYHPEQLPTDLASCSEHEHADDAAYTLFLHDYTIDRGAAGLSLKAEDLPETVTLKRR